jgi:hypothetical protein
MAEEKFPIIEPLLTPEFEARVWDDERVRFAGGRLWSKWDMTRETVAKLHHWLGRVLGHDLPADGDIPRFKDDPAIGCVVEHPSGEFVRHDHFRLVYDSHRWLFREKERLEAAIAKLGAGK